MRRTSRIDGTTWRTIGIALLLCAALPAWAQQPTAPAGTPVEAAGFTGKTAMLDSTGYSVGRRVFAPHSHNATWHMHSTGQLVFAESGQGRLQIKGQPTRVLAPGDSAYIPPNTFHWHGSAPEASFTMMFINMGASTTTQGEPITEAIYLGKQ